MPRICASPVSADGVSVPASYLVELLMDVITALYAVTKSCTSLRLAATSLDTLTVLVPLAFRSRVRPGTASVILLLLAVTVRPSILIRASVAATRSTMLSARFCRSVPPSLKASEMALAAPGLSEATDRNRPSLEVITLACTPLLRAASLIALRTSTSREPSAMVMSSVSPPTVNVSLPAPKVCSAVTGWLAVHLLALARSRTSMV